MNATQMLEQWGKWTWQQTGVPRYVSPLLALMRDNVPSTHAPAAAITEEDAEAVSAILARLKQRYSEAYEAVALYYRHGMTHAQVGRAMEKPVSRMVARELVIKGECYVQAVLDLRDAACNAGTKMRVFA